MAAHLPIYDTKDIPIPWSKEKTDPECLYNHALLGPKDLDKSHVPNALLQNYRRFGYSNPKKFLDDWFDRSTDQWKWPNPKNDGFVLDKEGHPIKGRIVLKQYDFIDRFGDENTEYFCPFGTPFMMRSLPPSVLKNPDPKKAERDQERYRVYRVNKDLTVDAGPIAPGFEQMGMGTQFVVPGRGNVKMSAFQLESDGIIEKLSDDEIRVLYQ